MGVVALLYFCWQPAVVDNPVTDVRQTLRSALHPPEAIEQTLRRACYDCHSNDTHWPWYAHFWPITKWLGRDVSTARSAVNFSEWSPQTRNDPALQQHTLDTSCSLMEAGMMPPSSYLYFHPNAKPSGAEVREFCAWARTAMRARTR